MRALRPPSNRRSCASFWMRGQPNNVHRGQGCPECGKTKQGHSRLSDREVVERFLTRGLEMIEPYKVSGVPILTKCSRCDYKWRVRPNHIFRGGGCPRCADYGF